MVNETIKIYTFAQNIDFVTPIEKLLPSITQSESLWLPSSVPFCTPLQQILTTGIFDSVSNFLIELPVISLQLTVVLFTFFFVMRDKEEIHSYT